jgi:hypothetical protein
MRLDLNIKPQQAILFHNCNSFSFQKSEALLILSAERLLDFWGENNIIVIYYEPNTFCW